MAARQKAAPKAKPKVASKKAAKAKEAQSERFIETARKIGVDESGKTFERAFGKIVPPRTQSKV